MRTITTTQTIYKYNELPSEKAKARARDWWRACEASDPAWLNEHLASARAAMRAVSLLLEHIDAGEDGRQDWERIIEESRLCTWTGYMDDCVLYDNSTPKIPSLCQVDEWYESAWQSECEYNNEDAQVVANIEANDYEFTEDGEIA